MIVGKAFNPIPTTVTEERVIVGKAFNPIPTTVTEERVIVGKAFDLNGDRVTTWDSYTPVP